MPFINTKTTKAISNSQKETLTSEFSTITRECLGKAENWVMTGYEDNASLSFQGSTENIAYVEVKTCGAPSSAGTNQMTTKVCELLERELDIPADRIYVAFFSTNDWGWNGSNF